MKLREISPSNDVTNLGMQGMERGAPVLLDAEFRAKTGDLERKETRQGAQGGAVITRALNNDNARIAYTPAYRNITKAIISRDVDVDKVAEQRGEDPIAVLADRTLEEFFFVGQLFQAMFFTGDSGAVATNFDGLENIVAAQGRTVAANANLPLGGDAVMAAQQAAMETLLTQVENVITFQPEGLVYAYCNGALKARLLSAAKNLGYLSDVRFPDGRVMTNVIHERIVLRSAGLNAAGNALLPFTEAGNGGASSSVWFVSWDENGTGVHFLTSQGLVGEYNGPVGNHWKNNFNMDCGLGCRNANALVRSTGWVLG